MSYQALMHATPMFVLKEKADILSTNYHIPMQQWQSSFFAEVR